MVKNIFFDNVLRLFSKFIITLSLFKNFECKKKNKIFIDFSQFANFDVWLFLCKYSLNCKLCWKSKIYLKYFFLFQIWKQNFEFFFKFCIVQYLQRLFWKIWYFQKLRWWKTKAINNATFWLDYHCNRTFSVNNFFQLLCKFSLY